MIGHFLRHGLKGALLATGLVLLAAAAGPASAQNAPPAPDTSADQNWTVTGPPTAAPANEKPPAAPPAAPATPKDGNITVVPRSGNTPEAAQGGEDTPIPVELVALLTADGQRIDQGVVWRVYKSAQSGDARGILVATQRTANPVVPLKPGAYVVNAAFGRAHLTRRITVAAAATGTTPQIEQFVLNAGGLRVTTMVGGKAAPPANVAYSIFTDRDQTDDRKLILAGAKPGLVIRLNAGIYHVVSTYGDANATVRSDVTVEAGKLTEATLVHTFSKVSFKLVSRAGGEALPDTSWTIQTPEGAVVKESVGALPSHTLAPGRYTVVARNQNKAFRRDFAVQDGQSAEIELVLQ